MTRQSRTERTICAFVTIIALYCLFGCPQFASAQVSVTLNPYSRQQFFDSNGNPLAGGCVFTYQAGSSTPLATYTDNTGLFQNSNPLILDSAGFGTLWLTANAYKFVLFSAGGVNCASGSQQWTLDFVSPPPFLGGNNIWTGIQTFNAAAIFNSTITMNGGGSMNGSFAGSPNFTGAVVFSGNPVFTGSPDFTNATPVYSTKAIPNLNPEMFSIVVANEGATGTTANKLVKLTGAPSTAISTAITDIGGTVGICLLNCATSGSATIEVSGLAQCVFDGATTAGDYVQISGTTAGDCHDLGGGGFPTSGIVIGRVLTTNGAGGTFTIDLFPPENRPSGSATPLPNVVFHTPSASTNANIAPVTMFTPGADSDYRVSWYMSVSAAGAGCGGSSTTVNLSVNWTDPLGGASSLTSNNNGGAVLLTTGNGVAGAAQAWNGNMSPGVVMFTFRAKSGQVIQYSTAYTIGAGCAPGPSYQVFPVLEQLTAN